MKLSISNIAFDKKDENLILQKLKENNFDGLEIAPTMFIDNNPYENSELALKRVLGLKENYGLIISSIQSILYGKSGNIFNRNDQRKLLENIKQVIDFASIVKCENIVFGCPKNRNININQTKDDVLLFFYELGNYAIKKGTVLAIEPNPTIYNTNFLNYTEETIDFVRNVNCSGIKVNVDFGAIIENKESLEIIKNNINLINHIHISEPYLKPIQKRAEHSILAKILKEINYEKFISIEMKKMDNIDNLMESICYVKKIFKDDNNYVRGNNGI